MFQSPSAFPTTHKRPSPCATPAPLKMPQFPSPVSIDHQDIAMNMEEPPIGINAPISSTPHSRNNSLSSDIPQYGADASLETHRMLSTVLYDLRLEYGKQWSTPECETPRRDGIFRSVSLLIAIMEDQEDPTGASVNMDSTTNITFMLTLTAVSMILNIYKSLCQMYSNHPGFLDVGKNPTEVETLFPPLLSQSPNASGNLDKVVQLTTMDFHLARLQRMFSTPNTPSSFQTALIGTGEGSEQIHELRLFVQRLVEKLKST